jgi:urea carboxylase
MFSKVLVANRGEIACRVIRTLDRLGIASVAVYSEADAQARHVAMASESVCIGAAVAAESYLRWEKILDAARETGANAIHPGYGFLSENAEFAEACAKEGIVFIGPTPEQMRSFGLKHTARALAAECNVPLLPGTELLSSVEEALVKAEKIGYPVMLKSTAGGGGIGLQLCRQREEMADLFERVQRLSQNNFGQGGVFIEKYVERARHIEVQIFGDGKGNVVALGERDCSVQRRNQKVIEETPAPGISDEVRAALCQAAVKLGKAVSYQSAGTVEFVFDADTNEFYFLEVNTRLQVEHGVTEEVTGTDLVEWMVKQAAGEFNIHEYQHQPQGHSIQVRIYAEDSNKNFQPNSGLLTEVVLPEVRCDGWVEQGTEVSPYYDPLLVKIIVKGHSREEAIAKLKDALETASIAGIETNLEYLSQVIDDPAYKVGGVTTKFLNGFVYQPNTIDVVEAGSFSTIQDYPGRLGYWDIGVPPSGPMDHLAFRFANSLVGNSESAAGLEFTITGPTLRFNVDTVIALTGAQMPAQLNGEAISYWTAISVKAGSVLKLKAIEGQGSRTYLAVRNGFDVPNYLGSKSTFTFGQFGGHGGRVLRAGDVLKICQSEELFHAKAAIAKRGTECHRRKEELLSLPQELIPQYTKEWEIGVMYGPHGAPDFFTDDDIQGFFGATWEVHYNSSRTGLRLIGGPKPKWARLDGGEAGLHPSNLHDNPYAIGAINFTGDMPIILGPDGPSLGGFVCPATIVKSEIWKIGQLKPGDKIRFIPMTFADALAEEKAQDEEVTTLKPVISETDYFADISNDYFTDGQNSHSGSSLGSPILLEIPETPEQIAVTYRQAGDKYILIEYGAKILDMNLRFRIYALMEYLAANPLPGIIDITPGVRTLQIHYDSRVISQPELIARLGAIESQLPAVDDMEVKTRIVYMPMGWDDESVNRAIEKYMQSVRKTAPWCPSNIEFIRRLNGLDSIEEVRDIVFQTSYMVFGLGDVYLGAPCAVPIDPRHRLLTSKYNPARTYTPEGVVGIGGVYMCIYGMDSPGGYQLIGRTVPIWNKFIKNADFFGKPWLLRFFDQVRFYPVSEEELTKYRADFLTGKARLRIEEETFSLKKYNEFLASIADDVAEFKAKQQQAFEEERQRWAAEGQDFESAVDLSAPEKDEDEIELPPQSQLVKSHIPANVWQILVKKGDVVEEGDKLVILESMKMEIAITAPVSGTIYEVLCTQGKLVSAGQGLVIIQE